MYTARVLEKRFQEEEETGEKMLYIRHGTNLLIHACPQTSVFWHSVNGTIVNAIYNCDNESGTFVRQGPEYVISETANVKNSSIHENTGLAVELLGSTAGYRVYYHDNKSQVQELFYTTKTNWNYGGIVSQDPVSSFALGTGHSSTDNITVVFPKSDKDIEVSRFNSDNSWHICK